MLMFLLLRCEAVDKNKNITLKVASMSNNMNLCGGCLIATSSTSKVHADDAVLVNVNNWN